MQQPGRPHQPSANYCGEGRPPTPLAPLVGPGPLSTHAHLQLGHTLATGSDPQQNAAAQVTSGNSGAVRAEREAHYVILVVLQSAVGGVHGGTCTTRWVGGGAHPPLPRWWRQQPPPHDWWFMTK